MEGEIGRIIKAWFTILASLTYCYYISKNIPKGLLRLLSVLPIISIFTFLPLSFSTGHLRATTGLFISWLANFKLLLLSFGHGPLSSPLTLQLFISISCLPVKIKEKIPSASHSSTSSTADQVTSRKKSGLNYVMKVLILALLFRVNVYKQYLHPYFMLCLFVATCTSQDRTFYGLGTTIQPTLPVNFTARLLGKEMESNDHGHPTVDGNTIQCKWGLLSALLATFLVSGFMHELMFFYMSGGGLKPNWEVMWFFVLHGICLALEVAVKRSLATEGWRLHRLVSGSLTLGFFCATSFWLFFPAFARLDAATMASEEIIAFIEFVKGTVAYINV
ncbi:hypothetical protein MKW92_011391 [Papaver armeniacum]|nr:hypothetical protein MKW92_011391 [Papaver armeniacum]